MHDAIEAATSELSIKFNDRECGIAWYFTNQRECADTFQKITPLLKAKATDGKRQAIRSGISRMDSRLYNLAIQN
jgi:hypothetical protein